VKKLFIVLSETALMCYLSVDLSASKNIL